MKNIVTIFDYPGDFDFPFDTEEYLTAYQDLSKAISEHGGQLYFARDIRETHVSRTFPRVSFFDSKGELKYEANIVADVIYDKSKITRIFEVQTVINHHELKRICNDKFETYQNFPELSPKTVVATNPSEYQKNIQKFEGRIVVKPRFGAKGEGVIIEDRDKIQLSDITFPCVIQEFVDGSVGMDGLVKGVHDLRMVIINGEIIMSYFRIPLPGSLLSNLHQGGSMKILELSQLPSEAQKIAERVDEELKKFGLRFYTIDTMNTSTGLKLVELNSQPGLVSRTRSNLSYQFLSHVARLLCSISSKP